MASFRDVLLPVQSASSGIVKPGSPHLEGWRVEVEQKACAEEDRRTKPDSSKMEVFGKLDYDEGLMRTQ